MDQNKNSENNAQPQELTPQEPRKPSIHTMKSDMDELLKSTKPSLIQILSEEAKRAPRFEKKPQDLRKYYPLAIGGLVAVAILAVLGLGYFLMPERAEEPKVATPAKLIPPVPLFSTETSRTINANTANRAKFLELIEDSYREPEREGTIKQVLIKLTDGPQERFATAKDFFDLYRLNPPDDLLKVLDPKLMIFFRSSNDGPRLGLATKVTNADRALAGMFSWEDSVVSPFIPLFFEESIDPSLSSEFEDRTYRNLDWRYIKLSPEKDLGIAYTVFPAKNILVITTSKSSMEAVIDRLFDLK